MNWFYNLIQTVQTHISNIVNHFYPPMPAPVMKEITEEPMPVPKVVQGSIGPILFENLNPMFLNHQPEPDPELVPEPKTVTGCIGPILFENLNPYFLNPQTEITIPDIQPFVDKIPDIAPSNNYWKGCAYPIGDGITFHTDKFPNIPNFKTPQNDWSGKPKDVQKHLKESAYYIWWTTGADAQWCWEEAVRRYGND